jgi:hypothetical protein
MVGRSGAGPFLTFLFSLFSNLPETKRLYAGFIFRARRALTWGGSGFRAGAFFSMSEHRVSTRRRILKAGTILIDRKVTIDCLVRNVSDTGACLEIESPVGIPNDFTLVIKADHKMRLCHVQWRSARRIGVRFQ